MTTPSLSHLATLADSTRSRLLLVLEGQELAVSELIAILQLPQSTVSRHLKVLGDDGWVTSRADGTSRYYRMAESPTDSAARLWSVVREDLLGTPAIGQDLARRNAIVDDRRRRSRQYFSGVAGQWDEVRRELFGSQLDLHVALAMIDREAVVGDLGCGSGHVAQLLAPHVARVIAVDAQAEMLATARERLAGAENVEVRMSDLERLPIETGTLDIALCSLVLHYVSEPGRVAAEAWRALKPGGRMIVIDMLPHEREELRHAMGHVWTGFSERQVRAWLGEAGFSRIEVRPLPVDSHAKGPGLFLASAVR